MLARISWWPRPKPSGGASRRTIGVSTLVVRQAMRRHAFAGFRGLWHCFSGRGLKRTADDTLLRHSFSRTELWPLCTANFAVYAACL